MSCGRKILEGKNKNTTKRKKEILERKKKLRQEKKGGSKYRVRKVYSSDHTKNAGVEKSEKKKGKEGGGELGKKMKNVISTVKKKGRSNTHHIKHALDSKARKGKIKKIGPH